MRISPSIIQSRILSFQKKLQEYGLYSAVVSQPDNIFYFSGHRIGQGNGPCCIFIPISAKPVLVIPEGERSLPAVSNFPGNILPYTVTGSAQHYVSAPVKALYKEYGGKIKLPLGAEAEHLPLQSVHELGISSDKDVIDIEHDILTLRMIKDEAEISLIKTSARIADRGQEEAQKIFDETIDEIDLQTRCRASMERAVGKPIECQADVLFGKRTSLIGGPVGVAGPYRAKKGDPAIVDLLPRVNGYYADTTRTLWLGSTSSERKKIIKLLCNVKEKLETLLKPGIEAEAIDAAARGILSREGLFPHHTGHGIGISSFEAPYITPDSNDIIKEGMTITLEPGVYFENWGARIEDDYLITEEGFIKLSGTGDG